MKCFTRLTMAPVVPAFLCLTIPQTADACLDQAANSTILQVLTAVLVGGLFAANHFRSQIKAFLNLFSRAKKRERTKD